MTDAPRWTIRGARRDDIEDIIAIENASFSTPWPAEAFEDELTRRIATYLVAAMDERVVGYAGMWCVAGEAHVMNVAVAHEERRRGIGEALVLALLTEAADQGVSLAYLERREDNHAAARLYGKLGFADIGRRRGYYQDSGEDAILMVVTDLSEQWAERLPGYWSRWEDQHGRRPDIDRGHPRSRHRDLL